MMTIGIPRALLYYKQFPFWNNFFSKLGARVVVSEETNADILNQGVGATSSEICLPVKVFFGHTLSLKNKCDFVFIPRIISVEKQAYTCPKLMGLPDMIKALPDHPPILSIDINAKKKRRYFYRNLHDLASRITKNPYRVYKAYSAATKELQLFHKTKQADKLPSNKKNSLKIGVVGHPYNIFDPYVSLNFLNRIKAQGIEVQTLENIPGSVIEEQTGKLSKPIFWTYEKEVVGTVMHWLKTKTVDGIFYLLAFACGPDSLMQVLVENQAQKENSVPLMSVVLDEHSGEAGFLTRVEAFIDMLKAKKAGALAS